MFEKMLRSVSPFLINLILLTNMGLPSTAYAEKEEEKKPRWFEIELILFSNNDMDAGTTEYWEENNALPDLTNAVILIKEPEPLAENDTINTDQTISTTAITPIETKADKNQTTTEINTEITTDPTETIIPFKILKNDEFRMLDYADKIKRSPKYDLLLHTAWRQPVKDKDVAEWVIIRTPVTKNIDEDEDKDKDGAKNENDSPGNNANTAVLLPSPTEDNQFDNEIPLPELDGKLQVSVKRFLHINTQLIFRSKIIIRTEVEAGVEYNNPSFQTETETTILTEPIYEPDFIEQEIDQVFLMKQSRRMRSKRFHYFDHPMFGMLAIITPYELPEPVAPAKPEVKPDTVITEQQNTTSKQKVEQPEKVK